MERVVAGRAFTLSKTFYSDGAAVAPTGTPTLTLTRVSDGTTVPTSVVTGTGTGPFQVTVTAANNLLLDTLTATWTATITAQASTYVDTVEVAGGTICTLAELRAEWPHGVAARGQAHGDRAAAGEGARLRGGPVTIGYEHGEDFPDSDIAEAALLLADEAYGSAVDGRVVRQEADNMAVTYASPSSNGPFIGARLNQIIRANRMPSIA
jgi:hypothetical protein